MYIERDGKKYVLTEEEMVRAYNEYERLLDEGKEQYSQFLSFLKESSFAKNLYNECYFKMDQRNLYRRVAYELWRNIYEFFLSYEETTSDQEIADAFAYVTGENNKYSSFSN